MTGAETDESGERSITVNRVIEAPPELVYEAFVDPVELAAWFPPEGFSAEVHEFDAREGGTFRLSFNADTEGLEPYAHTFHGAYDELTPGERIVYTTAFESDDPGMAGEPTTTVTSEAVSEGTEVTVRHEGFPEAIPPSDANEGWIDSLENLTDIVQEA